MSDERAKAIFGDAVADDPYEGLPRHMVESVPHTVEVIVHQQQPTDVGGEQKIMLDAAPRSYTVQLERDGVPLTKGDLPQRWVPGEKEGWR